jgi:hypothetical protein
MFLANHCTLLLVHQDVKLMNTQRVSGRSQSMKPTARILSIHRLVEGRMSWMRRKNMRKMLKKKRLCQMKKWRLDILASATGVFFSIRG